MSRTTVNAVKAILLADYNVDDGPSLQPYIDTANALTSRVAACAADRGLALLNTELELIERWLAAHFYAVSDKPYSSKTTAGASASFQGQTAKYLEFTGYGQMAVTLDPSGCLAAIASGLRRVAGGFWLGKAPSEQIPYEQRR